jgi:hypothetical protein
MRTSIRRLSAVVAVLTLLGACAERTETPATDTAQPATAPSGEGADKSSASKGPLTAAISPGAKSISNVLSRGTSGSGSLAASDPRLGDNSHYDMWFYDATAGQTITVNMQSADFDTYLILARLVGNRVEFLAEDDDGGDGLNSQLTATLPAAGTYFILANSYGPDTTGAYTLQTDVR